MISYYMPSKEELRAVLVAMPKRRPLAVRIDAHPSFTKKLWQVFEVSKLPDETFGSIDSVYGIKVVENATLPNGSYVVSYDDGTLEFHSGEEKQDGGA